MYLPACFCNDLDGRTEEVVSADREGDKQDDQPDDVKDNAQGEQGLTKVTV